ncbi:MAG: hypothetical protein WC234_02975 [Endomicrobiaceae bacterium]
MAKVQGFEVVKEGLLNLKDVYQVMSTNQGVQEIGQFVIPKVGEIFTSMNAMDQSEFNKSLMAGELRVLIEEGAVRPVEIEASQTNLPEFNSRNEKDLSNMSIEELEKMLEAKKKQSLITKIMQSEIKQEENKVSELDTPVEAKKESIPSEKEIENFKKEYDTEDNKTDNKEVDKGISLTDYFAMTHQSRMSFISKTTDKQLLKEISDSAEENSMLKKRAVERLTKLS